MFIIEMFVGDGFIEKVYDHLLLHEQRERKLE